MLLHDKESRGALAYLALAGEMIRREDEVARRRPRPARRVCSRTAAVTQKKPSLGRGLNALIGCDRRAAPGSGGAGRRAPVSVPAGDRLTRLPLDILQRGRYQPRSHLDQESLNELAASIRSQGVVQPIVVRPIEATTPSGGQRYEIIAGERRWRAAQIAQLRTFPPSCAMCRTRPRFPWRSSRTSSARI